MKALKTAFLLPLVVILFITGLNLNAQNKNLNAPPSYGLAPAYNPDLDPNHNLFQPKSLSSRGMGVNNTAAATSEFSKFTVGNPSGLTAVNPTLAAASFAGGLGGDGKYYIIDNGPPVNLYSIDTTTGVKTLIAPVTGVFGTEGWTELAYDRLSGIWYASSGSGSPAGSSLYTFNIATGVATRIGAINTGLVITIAIHPTTNIMYGIDIVTDGVISINKTTGVGTPIGPLGFDCNYGAGSAFDEEGTLYFAGINNTTVARNFYTINLTSGTATLIGAFPPTAQVSSMGIHLPPVGYPLNAFNLQTPTAGARIVTVAGSSTPVTITWDTSATGANYKFIFGTPLPTRRVTIASGVNSVTTTLGALDAILAANGFTNNGTASDSAVGNWDVWAFKATGIGGADSLKSTNGPRALTFRRQQVALTPFALTAPAAGTSITTSPVNSATVSFTWGTSGGGATYRWLFKNAATYSDPAFLRALSDGSGFTNSWTVRNSRLDSLLAAAGVAPGDSVVGVWRARAYSSSDSLNSTAPDRSLTLRRASLLPLDQHFEDAAMPPVFWQLSIGSAATQYWTREPVGAFGLSTGSAKYNFYNAQATTGPQTLTSNQFPAVAPGGNNLRFNYAGAYYSATAIDSMVIETSTDAGANWTRLIGMYHSTSLSSGTNNSAIMSTVVLSNAVFTPTAGQWATKIFSMPVGTNMVRFIAKSAYGNNLFIDDITSGGPTGVGDPISFTPTKYELFQNYPNPFNPTTKINFSLPKQGLVTLKIYDMLGKEVAQLVNEVRTVGNYSIDFNAANLSSGVYFYKLTAEGFSDVKRMMLIK